jgi:hypothetical protein
MLRWYILKIMVEDVELYNILVLKIILKYTVNSNVNSTCSKAIKCYKAMEIILNLKSLNIFKILNGISNKTFLIASKFKILFTKWACDNSILILNYIIIQLINFFIILIKLNFKQKMDWNRKYYKN